MKQLGSNLATPTGLVILLVGILASAYVGITGLEVLLLGAFIICLIAFLWTRASLRSIEVDISGDDCCGFPGEILKAQARLSNNKMLPLIWLTAEFPTGKNECIAPLEDEYEPYDEPSDDGEVITPDAASPAQTDEKLSVCEHFLWVMPHQKIVWEQQVRAVKRGISTLRSLTLSSGDGFGLSERFVQRELSSGFRFVVYPEVRPLSVSILLSSLSEMEKASRGFYTDATLISSIRDYRDGDSMKDINWRLLARTGETQVNVHERLDRRRMCLVPDFESFVLTERKEVEREIKTVRSVMCDEFEHMLSLMASIIAAADERGILCSLVLPGIGTSGARLVIPEDASLQVTQLLTALSGVEFSAETTELPAEEIIDHCHALGQVFIFTRKVPEAENTLEQRLGELPLRYVVCADCDTADRRIISERELECI